MNPNFKLNESGAPVPERIMTADGQPIVADLIPATFEEPLKWIYSCYFDGICY